MRKTKKRSLAYKVYESENPLYTELMKTKTKRVNKPDLTTRNLKAQKKREATLRDRVKALEVSVRAHERDLSYVLSHLMGKGR